MNLMLNISISYDFFPLLDVYLGHHDGDVDTGSQRVQWNLGFVTLGSALILIFTLESMKH
jgi:hypothetical protein